MILTAAIVVSFSMSTFAWVAKWMAAFIQNGYYFDVAEKNLANRQREGVYNGLVLLYVLNALASAQVSSRQHIITISLLRMSKLLVGDALVIWRTWALWQGSWRCYVPIGLWIASLSL
jgi:hypothetical protein